MQSAYQVGLCLMLLEPIFSKTKFRTKGLLSNILYKDQTNLTVLIFESASPYTSAKKCSSEVNIATGARQVFQSCHFVSEH